MIVLATAHGHYRPPVLPRAGRGSIRPPANSGDDQPLASISFTIDERIKGEWGGAASFNLPGSFVGEADEGKPDSRIPRRAARGNGCIVTTYVDGGQYLFLFRRLDDGLVIDWAPLSPANERIRGEKDPWLGWVRTRAAVRRGVESH